MIRIAALALLLLAASGDRLLAQGANKPETSFKDRWAAGAAAKRGGKARANAQKVLPVSPEQALYLIRSTLLTLNDANRSGNYTVLRDLAAPGFRQKNSAADLAGIFAELRRRNFDLFAAALVAPKLTAAPALDQQGFLRLTGYFPTRPLQIKFDLMFQNVGHHWKLFGIAVATPEAVQQTSQRSPEAQKVAHTQAKAVHKHPQ